MTVELTMLTLVALLAASLWIPYIVGVNLHPVDEAAAFVRPPNLSAFPAWVHRAHRAHLNLLEQALPFALLVIVAHLLAVSTVVTVWASAAFLALRLVHAVGMISGVLLFPARPIIFTGGYLCILLIAWQVLAHG